MVIKYRDVLIIVMLMTSLAVNSAHAMFNKQNAEYRINSNTAKVKHELVYMNVAGVTKNENSITTSSYSEDEKCINYLVATDVTDKGYIGVTVELSEYERELVKQIIRTEAGTGFIEQALVAQCIRDTIVYYGASGVEDVYTRYQYDCKWDRRTTEETEMAVQFIFDGGGVAVQHRICYFYAPNICDSRFHERQDFVCEYGGHRYFSEASK